MVRILGRVLHLRGVVRVHVPGSFGSQLRQQRPHAQGGQLPPQQAEVREWSGGWGERE